MRYTALALCVLCAWDLRQTKSTVLRSYPVIGHLRFMLEKIRPEMRQYFIESDTKATPFSRSLAYAHAKDETDKRPFGTQLNVTADGHEWISHSLAPMHVASHDFRLTIGGPDCARPYEASLFNISAMRFGELSANAIQTLNSYKGFPKFASNNHPGSIAAQSTQALGVQLSSDSSHGPVVAGC